MTCVGSLYPPSEPEPECDPESEPGLDADSPRDMSMDGASKADQTNQTNHTYKYRRQDSLGV